MSTHAPLTGTDRTKQSAPSLHPGRRAPALVTRLVSAGLVVVAVAVLATAMGQSQTSGPRARPAAQNDLTLVVAGTQPDVARLLGASRVGDAIMLRVDPVGTTGPRNLITSPGARVTMLGGIITLEQLLDTTVGRGALVSLTYDGIGQVVGLSQRAG